jgi:peptidoglycan hydrolase CwlO-like protein
MENLISLAVAAVVGITSKSAFDYYWKIYKNKSENGHGGALAAKDEMIRLLKEQQDSLITELDELRNMYVDLTMEVATLRADNNNVVEKLKELEKSNFELKTMNEILKRK